MAMHYVKSEDFNANAMQAVLAVCVDLVVSQTIPIVLKMLGQTLLSVVIGNIDEVMQGTPIKRKYGPNS